jgi:hypothetical protein
VHIDQIHQTNQGNFAKVSTPVPSSQRVIAYPLRNASRSALIWSLCVEHMPWSKPG